MKVSGFAEICFIGHKTLFSQILSKFIFRENFLLHVTNLKQVFDL